MEDKYKVSKKNAQGKWWSWGNVSKNQYGNHSLGFKVTPELKAIFNGTADGEWVNFSLFKDDGEYAEKPSNAASANNAPVEDISDDEIPF